MNQYGINALQAGVRSLGGLANLGSARDTAFDQALTSGATGRLRLAQARKTREEALGAEMANAALAGLEQSGLGDVLTAQGIQQPNVGAWANLMRAGGGDFKQLMEGMRIGSESVRQQRAVDTFPQDRELANVMLEAAGRRAYTPFSTNTQGITTNEATGQVDLGNDMAQHALRAMQALTAQRGAAAGASSARAAQIRAQMDPNNPITAADLALTQARTGAANARASGVGGGGGGTSADFRQAQELAALGVPPEIARGVAYGTIKPVKSDVGLSTLFIDMTTGKVLYEVNDDRSIVNHMNPAAGAAGGAAGAPGGSGLPTPGDVVDGYRYRGGDPNNQANWEPAQ